MDDFRLYSYICYDRILYIPQALLVPHHQRLCQARSVLEFNSRTTYSISLSFMVPFNHTYISIYITFNKIILLLDTRANIVSQSKLAHVFLFFKIPNIDFLIWNQDFFHLLDIILLKLMQPMRLI